MLETRALYCCDLDGIHLRISSHKQYLRDFNETLIKDIKEKIQQALEARKDDFFRKDSLLSKLIGDCSQFVMFFVGARYLHRNTRSLTTESISS